MAQDRGRAAPTTLALTLDSDRSATLVVDVADLDKTTLMPTDVPVGGGSLAHRPFTWQLTSIAEPGSLASLTAELQVQEGGWFGAPAAGTMRVTNDTDTTIALTPCPDLLVHSDDVVPTVDTVVQGPLGCQSAPARDHPCDDAHCIIGPAVRQAQLTSRLPGGPPRATAASLHTRQAHCRWVGDPRRRTAPTDWSTMKALTWQGKRDVRVEEVPDPRIEVATDAVVRVTSTAICGSDLHLYEVLGAYLTPGDILGHETMGIVEEVGPEVTHIKAGDRVVVPFNISCGSCWMCSRGLFAQCETTQVREQGKGASLFGYTSLYGAVPGGQAEYLRVPQAHFGPIKVPEGPSDQRFLYLSDILPTAWQAVAYADVPKGGTIAVIGLGPVGQLATRIARYLGAERIIGVDLVPERLALAAAHGVETLDLRTVDDVAAALIEMTGGRGPDAVVEAVGMEAHGSGAAKTAQAAVGLLPDVLAKPLIDHLAIDRLAALTSALKGVRRGGTVSISGVYGGEVDPLPLMEMFDRGIQLRMGQCHVKRWIDDIMPLALDDSDPLGTEQLATHVLPLDQASEAYEMFQKKSDGCIKVVLTP